MELFKKVYIRSKEDLPKADRAIYFVGVKGASNPKDIYEWFNYINPIMKEQQEEYWINTFAWYLQPTEIKFPSEDMVNKEIFRNLSEMRPFTKDYIPKQTAQYMQEVVKWAINWIRENNIKNERWHNDLFGTVREEFQGQIKSVQKDGFMARWKNTRILCRKLESEYYFEFARINTEKKWKPMMMKRKKGKVVYSAIKLSNTAVDAIIQGIVMLNNNIKDEKEKTK